MPLLWCHNKSYYPSCNQGCHNKSYDAITKATIPAATRDVSLLFTRHSWRITKFTGNSLVVSPAVSLHTISTFQLFTILHDQSPPGTSCSLVKHHQFMGDGRVVDSSQWLASRLESHFFYLWLDLMDLKNEWLVTWLDLKTSDSWLDLTWTYLTRRHWKNCVQASSSIRAVKKSVPVSQEC